MTSKREQILSAFYTRLKTLETSQIKVNRNQDKPQKVPDGGLIILRDGQSDEPEVMLSPLTYIYEHSALLEIMVQNPDAAARSNILDSLLVSIGALIAANRTLSGVAEWSEAKAPDFIDEPIEGAATIRAATVAVLLRFSTTDPLN